MYLINYFIYIASISSNSKNSKSNSLVVDQEIWTGQKKQDPKKFQERYTALQGQKGSNYNQNASKNKPKNKVAQNPTFPKKLNNLNEDYVEDEMDESVKISLPKNMPATNQNNIYHNNVQDIKKKKDSNPIQQIPSNPINKNLQTFPQNVNINFAPPQYYPIQPNFPTNNASVFQTITGTNLNQIPQNEYNFININIAPGNGKITQNIYMNFPPGSNFPPITNVNNNNIMITTNPANKKINLDNIIIGKDKRTTLMLRNIPNKYTLHNIVDEIGPSFWGKYDCINLPIDYETKLNLGYAFINFTDPFHIIHFFSKFHLKKWSRYKSEKKMDMTYADKQGKKDITLKAENNYFPQDDKRFDFKMIKPLIEIPCVS